MLPKGVRENISFQKGIALGEERSKIRFELSNATFDLYKYIFYLLYRHFIAFTVHFLYN